jgi:MYXO-CTERM domain-containing protein
MKVVTFAITALALSGAYAGDAHACGGCLVQQTENTQVTSHRMILSISPRATTLWDQITYSGAPESFAWVLPVQGLADVQLSSDALFETLDQMTSVQVFSPQINCNPGNCGNFGPVADGAESSTGGGTGGGVTVVAQNTVGPYEQVQLSSSDPNALRNWLVENGYNIPDDITPVINAYVSEGFDFIALKLAPGEGVSSMRPVRITTPGAGNEMPLRMVAAGTGAVTPITLWVLGEGRYEPTNFSSFEIRSPEVVWNWDTQSSNYNELRSQGFAATGGRSWLVAAAEPLSVYGIRDSLLYLAQYQPEESGYADENGEGAVDAAQADMDALLSNIPENALWVSRLYGELSRAALGTDLEIGAAVNQVNVERYLQTTLATGTAPTCPPPPVCDEPLPGDDGVVPGMPTSSGDAPKLKPGSCATDGRTEGPLTLLGAVAFAALALVRRRNQR